MKEILKIRCHVSISMKKVIILRSIHAKNEVFRSTSLHHRKKLNIPLTCRFITYSIRIGNLDCCKFQKQPLKIFCEKRSSLKFRKVCTKRLWQRKHLWILRNVKEHFFLQNNSGRLFLKCGHCKNEAREIAFVVERWIQFTLFPLKSKSARKASRYPLLVTRISLIYLVDEFIFWLVEVVVIAVLAAFFPLVHFWSESE